MRAVSLLCLFGASLSAEKLSAPALLELAKNPDQPAFRAALIDSLGEAEIKKGVAYSGHGSDFIFAVESVSKPSLILDDGARAAMIRAKDGLWFGVDRLRTGTSHVFHYVIDGKRFGGREIPAYGPDSYERPGVPKGTLSEKLVHTSKIYEGMQSDYWIYAPAQYKPGAPAALMVWQDGQSLVDRHGGTRAQIVIDNLTHQKKVPVTIHVFISPGLAGGKRMRSIQYDSVDDRYARFLRDELLPEVYAKYEIRRDAYSRAIAGNSSGGICAFNAAWQQPDQFSRVLSRIGSFTSLQWQRGAGAHGGHEFPNLVRKEPKRNMRVWLQDGSEDHENIHGSWPLSNIELANSLKMREYDFHFSWGLGAHSAHHGNSELAEELAWLWRGYDPSKKEEAFAMDPAEKSKPYFRVKIYNRDFSGQDTP